MNKNVNLEFSNHAPQYNQYNIIQQIVAKALVRELSFKPKTILELGCGSGQVFKNIDFEFDHYKAIDFSQKMCMIHPKHPKLAVKCLDFDSIEFINELNGSFYDVVLSSSALQWSKNLNGIIQKVSKITNNIEMVLFTNNTFKTLFSITNTRSPILDLVTIKDVFSRYFLCQFETIEYKIEFETKKELFDYIKNSGVGAGNKMLNFKQAKQLYKEYPHNYLEFEVVFIKGKK
ncbi:MAG: methyltransferase [Campylobacterales bacterium]|nr:methyltransferase [Campylobacterales bacterium]